MATLKKAHNELFKRGPDECFDSFDDLYAHCTSEREQSDDLWERPQDLTLTHDLTVCVAGDGAELAFNDWSFSQACRMAGVSKQTINRLLPKTASKALQETLPSSEKPLQLLATEDRIRSVHGVAYTRLWNADVLDVVKEFSADFSAPQKAMDDARTGLYCGEQDMFAFLVDTTGWTEIDGQAFAPGFFVWNSEVGRRSVGIQSFWFQRICQNHIVWDAVEVVEFSRKHTANVQDALSDMRAIIESLIRRRDERRDSFASVIKKAMQAKLGADSDEVAKILAAEKIPGKLAHDALELARSRGSFTIFSVVDALTKLSQQVQFAGDRASLDARISSLFLSTNKVRNHQRWPEKTITPYLQAMDSFCNWLVSRQLLLANPLVGIARQNTETDVRHKRRALAQDEFSALIQSARNSDTEIQCFDGEQRARIYTLSFMTGLRRKEIASLTPRSFDLNAEPPTVTVEAACSKHRRKDVLPLHPDLVELLKQWLEGHAPEEPLFPKLAKRRAWLMVKKDLERVGIPYENERGIADFHAAGRHTHITELMRSGASLTEARELARHSDIRTTMKYTHIGIQDQAKALSKLPFTNSPKDAGEQQHDPPPEEDWQRSDSGKRRLNRHSVSSTGDKSKQETKKQNPCGNRGL